MADELYSETTGAHYRSRTKLASLGFRKRTFVMVEVGCAFSSCTPSHALLILHLPCECHQKRGDELEHITGFINVSIGLDGPNKGTISLSYLDTVPQCSVGMIKVDRVPLPDGTLSEGRALSTVINSAVVSALLVYAKEKGMLFLQLWACPSRVSLLCREGRTFVFPLSHIVCPHFQDTDRNYLMLEGRPKLAKPPTPKKYAETQEGLLNFYLASCEADMGITSGTVYANKVEGRSYEDAIGVLELFPGDDDLWSELLLICLLLCPSPRSDPTHTSSLPCCGYTGVVESGDLDELKGERRFRVEFNLQPERWCPVCAKHYLLPQASGVKPMLMYVSVCWFILLLGVSIFLISDARPLAGARTTRGVCTGSVWLAMTSWSSSTSRGYRRPASVGGAPPAATSTHSSLVRSLMSPP